MSRRLAPKPAPKDGSPGAAKPGAQASQPKTPPHLRRLTLAVCLFLAVAVWAVFGQTLRHEFVNYDDNENVYSNPNIVSGLSWRGVAWAFTHTQVCRWAPITIISRELDCTLYGLWAGGHHLSNVLLHGASAILLFLVVRQLTGAFWRSAFVAAVFALHPLRVESVAWISARGDVTSAFFFMLTLWAWVRYARQKQSVHGPPATASYLLALVFFVLGLMSKTMLVTLPFVLLLLDYWPLKRITLHAPRSTLLRLLWEKAPFLLLSAAACVVTVLAQRTATGPVQAFDLPTRVGNAFLAYAAYLGQMLYPAGLAAFYPHPGNRLSLAAVGLAALVLLGLSAGALAGRHKHPYLLVGWLWYLGMLVPVIGLVPAGDEARADRYTYLPQIGLYLAAAWGTAELSGSWRYRRAVLGSAAGVVLAGLMTCSYLQTACWKNSVSLWTHTLACTKENALAHEHLGLALADQAKWDEAIEQYQQALRIRPDYAYAHNNLGNALARQWNLTEAIAHFQRAIQLKPDYAKAYNNLGSALARQGKWSEAVEQYQRALQLKPEDATTWNNLGIALAAQGKMAAALPQFQQALNLATAQGNTRLAATIRTWLK